METPKRLHQILSKGESARMEFKRASVDIDDLGKTICAFLNSGGGQIVVGVLDSGQVEGDIDIKRIESMILRLSGGGKDALITPNAVWDLSEERLENGTVALIDVPSGADLPYVFRDSIYLRSGAHTRPASGTEIRALIDRRYLRGARWERQPVLEVKLSDLEESEILKTAQTASAKRGWQFRDINDPFAVLEDLNLVDHGRLTNAAVVLFAREAGHIFPQAQVRMTVYPSNKAGAQFSDDRVFRGHLFANLEAYEGFVKRNVPVLSDFSAAKAERVDSPMFPYWPLREGFRNALIHRDYQSIHGRVTVSMYPRRLEIWSYGKLPEGLEIRNLKTADRSLPVNPDIAQVVFLRGLVELLGRGTRKIVEEYKSLGLPEPIWEMRAGGLTLTLRGGQVAGKLPETLNARQIDLLRSLRPGETTNVSLLQESSGKNPSERAARNDLAGLVNLGFLVRQGKGKNTFYIRTEKPLA
jgi:ATP-dependent DNA helicase RecG